MKRLILVVGTVLWLALGAWAQPGSAKGSFDGAHLQTVSQRSRRRARRHHAHRARRRSRRHVRRHRS